MDLYGVSWVYWNYSNERSSGAVLKRNLPAEGPYGREHLKESGVLVCEMLRNRIG